MLEHTSASSRPGSPFAAELDRRLAGDEPLPIVVGWWRMAYSKWCVPQMHKDDGGPSIADLTANEDAVYRLARAWEFSPGKEPLTEDDANPDVQNCWGPVRQARETLRSATTGAPQ
jgi:hypothetical protein